MPKMLPIPTEPSLAKAQTGEGAWRMAVDTAQPEIDYWHLLLALMPRGDAWELSPRLSASGKPSTKLKQLLLGLSKRLFEADVFADHMMNEKDPRTAVELLEDWERICDLPDECLDQLTGEPSIAERQKAVVVHLAATGGSAKAYFEALAETLGYVDATGNLTVRFTEFAPMVAGESECGTPVYGEEWNHAFEVEGVDTQITFFRAGSGAAGDPLAVYDGSQLYCFLEKFRPAHLLPVYLGDSLVTNGTFEEDSDWTKGTNWVIVSGLAARTSYVSSSNIRQSIAITAGKTYIVAYKVKVIVGTNGVYCQLGGTSGATRNALGEYYEVIEAGSSNTEIRIVANASVTCAIDDVRVYEW